MSRCCRRKLAIAVGTAFGAKWQVCLQPLFGAKKACSNTCRQADVINYEHCRRCLAPKIATASRVCDRRTLCPFLAPKRRRTTRSVKQIGRRVTTSFGAKKVGHTECLASLNTVQCVCVCVSIYGAKNVCALSFVSDRIRQKVATDTIS